MTLQHLYTLLMDYRYEILLPIAIIEGPIIIIIAGFLASTGIFDVYLVFAVAVLGDVIGDLIYYLIGRLGRKNFLPKYGKYVGLTDERIGKLDDHYRQHFLKTLLVFKFTQIGISSVLVAAGATRTDLKKYLLAIVTVGFVKGFIFTAIGYYFGSSYLLLGTYLNDYAIAAGVLVALIVTGYLVYRLYKKRYE